MVQSVVYELFRQAMEQRRQVWCRYQGHARELCPHVLGRSGGAEMVLAYQVGGTSRKGLPPGGEWRCLTLSGVADARFQPGPWHSGIAHRRPQGCVRQVEHDVNPASPYLPAR